MRSSLSGGPGPYVLLHLFPFFAKILKGLQKPKVLVFGPATHFVDAVDGLLLLRLHDGLIGKALEDSLRLFELELLLNIIGELCWLLYGVVFLKDLWLHIYISYKENMVKIMK